jgi:ribonucleotide monophosphatase NagD (HAD superfamily)
LVLSGESGQEDLAASEFQPDIVAEDIAEMGDLLRKALAE